MQDGDFRKSSESGEEWEDLSGMLDLVERLLAELLLLLRRMDYGPRTLAENLPSVAQCHKIMSSAWCGV